MPEVTRNVAALAKELGEKYGTPSLVYRGFVLNVNEVSDGLTAAEFLGYGGTSSTFLVTEVDGTYEVCSVEVIEKPKVMRNKVKVRGLFKVITCSECP
ncbi:MAG: hypothetical protein J7L55_05695 [Desulfurococcales archaeon]|nr:hypothetical protein [Desulfurococcales archaeon]